MKKLFGIAGMALIAGMTAGAAQAQGYYVEAHVGMSPESELDWGGSTYDTDSGRMYGVAVGRSLWEHWDGEVEFSHRKTEYTGYGVNNTNTNSLSINLTRNFDLGGAITPYVGGGIGIGEVTYENPSYERSDTVGVYQVIAGARYAFAGNWGVFGEYRYQDTLSTPEDSGLEWEDNGHVFNIGLRYGF